MADSASTAWHALLRADAPVLGQRVRQKGGLIWICAAVILLGAGMYGAIMGSWRAPLQALYAGIKLPLAILLTTLGNTLLNGMLAPLLGLNITWRQSFGVILASFALMSLILAALSPVALFMIWNTPSLTAGTHLGSLEYAVMQLSLAGFIAFAGTVGNFKVLPLLQQWTQKRSTARQVLVAWLVANLFLGSQICWVLRPFIWDPAGPVQFIGRQYFQGSFFETVFEAVRRLIFQQA